ncbi:Phasin protein [Bradyrhizobium sp. URHC0002]
MARLVVFSEMTVVVDPTFPLERQMSKHKPAKRARSPKIAARAQRNKQAIVRSAKDSLLRSVAASPIESPVELHDDSKQKAPIVTEQKDLIVENRVAALKAAALEAAALPDGGSQMTRDNNPKKVFDFSLATVSMQSYQATLLEVAQANMKFAFEFSQRLATIRSPFDFFALIAEFTSRRIDMFGKHAKEMSAYPFWGIDLSRELTSLPER